MVQMGRVLANAISCSCLVWSGCVAHAPGRAGSTPPPQPPVTQGEPIAGEKPNTATARAAEVAPVDRVHGERLQPLDDPSAARSYGFPPGTVLRFDRPHDREILRHEILACRRTIIPERRYGDNCAPTAPRLLVFRSCSDDGRCRDSAFIREGRAVVGSPKPVHEFTQETGLVEAVTYWPQRCDGQEQACRAVYELTLHGNTDRSVVCVWPQAPYPTKRLRVAAGTQQPCRRAHPPEADSQR